MLRFYIKKKFRLGEIIFKLINGNCFEEMKNLIDQNIIVDLILTDPPYGTVKDLNLDGWKNRSLKWDERLPEKKMFDFCERLLRVNGVCILFSNEPYTHCLRSKTNENLPFSYPLYWLKDHFANSLSCKKAPVSYIEDLSVFRKKYDTNNSHPLRIYSQRLLEEIGLTYKQVGKKIGNRKTEHFFYGKVTQFSLCTKQAYEELIDVFHIDEFSFFKSYDELKRIDSKFKPTFNLNGEKYKSNILEYPKSYNNFHPTEKPVPLLEDLISTYSNEGDLVLDFTMGSGSTGVACKNLNRDFIGIEIDEDFFNIAKERCVI